MWPSEAIEHAKHKVALYTRKHLITGELHSYPPRRVIDMLNDTTMRFVHVHEATASLWETSATESPITHVAEVLMPKANIILAILLKEDETFREWRQRVQPIEIVRKQPTPVVILTEDFSIHGHIHLVPGTKLFGAPGILDREFLAVTDAQVYVNERPGTLLCQEQVVAINTQRISLMYTPPETSSS